MNARRGSDDEAEAERLLAELRNIPPQQATASTVEGYAMASQLLRDSIGSPLWFEAVIGIGSHLLENPDGDRGDNLHGALACYDVAIKAAEELDDEQQWTIAASGFANTLVTDPRSDQKALTDAIGLLKRVSETFRTRDWADVGQLTTCLGQLATAHAKVQDDPIGHLEEAIRIRQEAVRLLAAAGSEAGPDAGALLGRARHNLAVLLDQRRVGVRSQNVDRAVRLLEAALQDRRATADPVGRARTLRALAALYPEWSGADSQAHAERLADLAAEEAWVLDQGGGAVAARGQGWAFLERQRSALDVDLDDLYRRDRAEAIGWLNDCIENHSAALEVLDPDAMPLRWAEWMGGLGRLLGRGPSFGEWQYVDDAQDCFAKALDAFDPEDHLGLALLLLERWGELCHEIGDFPKSLTVHRRACDLSDQILRSTIDPDHRLVEIEEARGFALFAAYAAARAGYPEEAVALAERQRMRLQGDLLGAREVLTGPEPARSEMLEALARVQRLERELEELDQQDPDVQLERQRATLADAIGIDPSLLQMRRVDPGADDPNPVVGERSRLGAELSSARERTHQLLLPRDSAEPARGAEASKVAEALGSAVVYILATVHGGSALVALPDGSCDVLLLDDLTSDVTRELVHGGQATVGFVQAAVQGRRAALDGCLDRIASTLGPALFAPLTRWLVERGLARAILVPVGSVGLLPLHVATGTEVLYSQAPSARVLRAGGGPHVAAGLLLVGDPERDDRARLPFAVVEARAVERLAPDEPATVLIGPEATRSAVLAMPVPARIVHFGCHGRFRPSDPLASELLLAGDDRLTVGDLFAGRVNLSGAELVAVLACRSGNVEFRRTPDEALSFPGALMVAGVPSVVSTLWPAEDSASALFAVRLYALLLEDGIAPAEAVSQARLWLRDATAAELLDLVAQLRADLAPGDRAAQQALAELTASLRLHRADDAPYSGPELWAPFVHSGPA